MAVLKRFTVGEVVDERPATISSSTSIDRLTTVLDRTDPSESHASMANGVQKQVVADADREAEDEDEDGNEEPLALGEDADRTVHEAPPIIDTDGALVGIITYGDVVWALVADDREASVESAGTTDLVVGYPDERPFDVVVRIAENDVEQLPIVVRTTTTNCSVSWTHRT